MIKYIVLRHAKNPEPSIPKFLWAGNLEPMPIIGIAWFRSKEVAEHWKKVWQNLDDGGEYTIMQSL